MSFILGNDLQLYLSNTTTDPTNGVKYSREEQRKKTIRYIDDMLQKNITNDDRKLYRDIQKKIIISGELTTISQDEAEELNIILDKFCKLFFSLQKQSELYNLIHKEHDNLLQYIRLHSDELQPINLFVSNYDLNFTNTRENIETIDNLKYLIFYYKIIEFIVTRFNPIESTYNVKDQKSGIKQFYILISYFEKTITDIKVQLNKIIKSPSKDIIKDICVYFITFIDTYCISFELKLNSNLDLYSLLNRITNRKKDVQIEKEKFDNYLIENIKIYNPSPCKTIEQMNGDTTPTKNYKHEMYDKKYKNNYKCYSFTSKENVWYYSVFYKIDLNYFLYSSKIEHSVQNDTFVLFQCLIMNSVFEGNEYYKYGKFFKFLNEMLFPKQDSSQRRIICFVDNTKKLVDYLFDNLNEIDAFISDSTTGFAFEFESYKSKYSKYDTISFYTKQDDDYIDKNVFKLILDKMDGNRETNKK